MIRLRAILLARGPLALWLLAAAFAVRALVPQGYMVAPGTALTLIPCPQVVAAPVAATHGAMMHGALAKGSDGVPAHHDGAGGGDGVCAFAPLAQAAAGGADPTLLSAALALVFAAIIVRPPALPRPGRALFLRPPLRGPPATA